MSKIIPKGLIFCPLVGCEGTIVWNKDFDIAVGGYCNRCDGKFTLLLTQVLKPGAELEGGTE